MSLSASAPMDTATALRLNAAASFIGMALLGILDRVEPKHIVLVREASLGQLQTATEVVEAENAAAMASAAPGETRLLQAICAPAMLSRVKLYADNVQV